MAVVTVAEDGPLKPPDEIIAPLKLARFRFAIVGPLLAAPPRHGELGRELKRLSRQRWEHPITGRTVRFGVATIERWYYAAKNAPRDPVGALRRRVRTDAGVRRRMGAKLREALQLQHKHHPGWSYKLHADNLAVLVERDATLGPMPSYSTVRRYMQQTGLAKVRPDSRRKTPGAERAARRLEQREVRSYEMEHVLALGHCDFHVGSLPVLTPRGTWEKPILFGVLDDCSRLCCHAQWYLGAEDAEKTVHGLSQAILKRGLFRALMSDNGAGMIAAETVEGLDRLGIVHERTLAESPYQNGKQEAWWSQIEGRLLAMLEGHEQLTLEVLNEATCAWVELEYHQKIHAELGVTPLERFLAGPDIGRPSPSARALREAFRQTEIRSQRKSDGSISLAARRYEIPNRYRHMRRLAVRWARWDLSHVHLVDAKTDQLVCPLYPVDKHSNADGRRRRLEPVVGDKPIADDGRAPAEGEGGGMAPLLEDLIACHRQAGLPPAYLPMRGDDDNDNDEEMT